MTGAGVGGAEMMDPLDVDLPEMPSNVAAGPAPQ